MIVIIKGSDLTGKSTLAASLAAAHGWPIAKIRWDLLGGPEIETRAMARTTIEILRLTQPNIIFGRIYLSSVKGLIPRRSAACEMFGSAL